MATRVTLGQIKQYALKSKKYLQEDAGKNGIKIYLHWSAGKYESIFSDYHINITGSGIVYATTRDFSETLAHTWRRNSGSIGVSLCCAYNATSNNLGSYAPTLTQIDAIAQVGCILADALELEIDKKHILTHGEAADNEDGIWMHPMYGPNTTCERWDLEYLGTKESPCFNPKATDGSRGGDVLRGKMVWYRLNDLSKRI